MFSALKVDVCKVSLRLDQVEEEQGHGEMQIPAKMSRKGGIQRMTAARWWSRRRFLQLVKKRKFGPIDVNAVKS